MPFNLALKDVKGALVEALQPDGKKSWACELCNGRITVEELKQFSTRAPGVLVTVLNVDGWDQTNQQVTFAAFTTGKDRTTKVDGKQTRIAKGEIAEALALAVMEVARKVVLPHAVSRPQNFRAQNLYSGGVHKQGAALWGVTWQQAYHLKPDPNSKLVDMVEVWLRPTQDFEGPHAGADIDVSQPPQGEQP